MNYKKPQLKEISELIKTLSPPVEIKDQLITSIAALVNEKEQQAFREGFYTGYNLAQDELKEVMSLTRSE